MKIKSSAVIEELRRICDELYALSFSVEDLPSYTNGELSNRSGYLSYDCKELSEDLNEVIVSLSKSV